MKDTTIAVDMSKPSSGSIAAYSIARMKDQRLSAAAQPCR